MQRQRVLFIVYPGFELLDASGPIAVFHGANRALGLRGESPFYEISLASVSGGLVASSSGVAWDTRRLDRIRQPIDTLLVVGAERAPLLEALADPALREGINRGVAKAERFGSICTGVFLLASLGLLSNRRVATHWDACSSLARAFPSASVDAEALYVHDGPLWTSAGVSTGIDMALAMVGSDLDPAIASEVAKRLVLYARRPGHQSQFSPLLTAQAKADSPFADLISWIQIHLDAPLDVSSLAAQAGMTERTFHRRFVAAVGETPARFVETARLDAARMLLSKGMTLKAVARQVGLFPTTRLTEAFERRFHMSPRLLREMHAETSAT